MLKYTKRTNFLSGHLLMAGRVIMFKKTPNNHQLGWFPFTGDPAKFILWGEEKANDYICYKVT